MINKVDQGIADKISDLMKSSGELSWLVIPGMIVAALFYLFIITLLFVAVVEIAKAFFTAEFVAICLFTIGMIQDGEFRWRIFWLIVALAVMLLYTFMLIAANDENYGVGLGWVFLDSLWGGVVNIVLICLCCTVVMIPLAMKVWDKSDRY